MVGRLARPGHQRAFTSRGQRRAKILVRGEIMKKLRLMRCCRLLTWLAVLAWLAGCVHFTPYRVFWQDQRLVETAEDVGFAHVSVLSVAPWHEIEGMLQPSFDLTPEDARQRALPVTVRWEEKLMLALIGKVGVGADKPATPNAETKDQPGFKDWDKFEAANNPMLEYQLANALYQEVQILNNYVRYAAQSKDCEAFLVRLQVSIMPLAHDMPYDTYVNIGFMTEPEHLRKVMKRDLETTSEINREIRDRLCAQADPKRNTPQQDLDKLCKDSATVFQRTDPMFSLNCKDDKRCSDISDTPKAIPLLVTDSLEAAQTLTSAKLLMQAAAAVKRSFEGDAVGAELGAALDKERTKGRKDLTSTMTVTRVWDNFLRARFGAVRTDEKTYAMVPRNHNISILLLVPRCMFVGDKAQMVVTSSADFADAFTGKLLPVNTVDGAKTLKKLAAAYTKEDIADSDIDKIASYQQNQSQLGMQQHVSWIMQGKPAQTEISKDKNSNAEGKPTIDPELLRINENTWPWLWHDFASEHQYAQTQKTFLTLGKQPPPSFDQNQTPMLVDDGKEIVAYVSGAKLMPGEYRAFLKKGGKCLPANHIVGGNKARRLQIAFPSLVRSGLADTQKSKYLPSQQVAKAEGWKLVIRDKMDASGCLTESASIASFDTIYAHHTRLSGEDLVLLLPSSSSITETASGGDLTLLVYFQPPLGGDDVFLRMEGATLDKANSDLGDALKFEQEGKFKVVGSGKVSLRLTKLGKAVKFRSTLAGDPAGPPLSIGVVKAAAAAGGGDKQAAAGNAGVSVNITTNAPTQASPAQATSKDSTAKKEEPADKKEEKKAEEKAKPAN